MGDAEALQEPGPGPGDAEAGDSAEPGPGASAAPASSSGAPASSSAASSAAAPLPLLEVKEELEQELTGERGSDLASLLEIVSALNEGVWKPEAPR